MSGTQVFQCPNCGASLDYEGGDELTVRCPYCDSSVIVPEELRESEAAWDPSILGLSPDRIAELRELGRLVRVNEKIQAIKLYREIFGVGLQEAKDAVERLSEGKPVQVADMTIRTDGLFDSPMLALPAKSLKPAQPTGRTARWTGFVLLVVAAIVVMAVAIGAIVMMSAGHSFSQISTPVVQQGTPIQRSLIVGPTATMLPTPTPLSFAHVALTFGAEGTGPGRFTDARHIAVDGEGNIYVGEYSDGRIQVFDPLGDFISLWMIDAETPLRGLAADRQGVVYVVQGGEIFRYDGASGEPLSQVQYAEGWGFDDVTVMADGGLVAAWYRNRDDIVRFDAQGDVLWTVPAAISGQSGDSELDIRVAVDGLGNIYALGRFNGAVFKFTRDGKFVTRFGSQFDEPGQFRSPTGIAVDGQGRVYVNDSWGIQVFDSDGRYLDLIEVDGPAFALAFNDQDELFVAARHKVIKYVLREPEPD
jgi:DNA-directed RNA polymerase subunit RPC12/RpoP